MTTKLNSKTDVIKVDLVFLISIFFLIKFLMQICKWVRKKQTKKAFFVFLGCYWDYVCWTPSQQYILYKKINAIFSMYGKNGIIPWHFFIEFLLRPFEVVEVEWKSASKFWGCDLESWQSLLKLWLLTLKW